MKTFDWKSFYGVIQYAWEKVFKLYYVMSLPQLSYIYWLIHLKFEILYLQEKQC